MSGESQVFVDPVMANSKENTLMHTFVTTFFTLFFVFYAVCTAAVGLIQELAIG